MTEGHRLNRLAQESTWCCEVVLTKYVGFDGQREVRVISEDVNSFGDRDVVKVLTIDLHDLREDGVIDRVKKKQQKNQTTSSSYSVADSVSHLMAEKEKIHCDCW